MGETGMTAICYKISFQYYVSCNFMLYTYFY